MVRELNTQELHQVAGGASSSVSDAQRFADRRAAFAERSARLRAAFEAREAARSGSSSGRRGFPASAALGLPG